MIIRPFWIEKLKNAWKKRPVIWLSGARRTGKTTLTKMIGDVLYLNCELPSVNRRLEDPESFYGSISSGTIIVFDEIHRLDDPSRVLKIGSDEYPEMKILATGSSTLGATKKFSDTLTGRKTTICLPPVIWDECMGTFGIKDLDHRLLHGGLPESLLSEKKDVTFFSEWFDSFYARDIQELFNIRNRSGYLKLMHLLYRSSGNMIDYTQLAKNSGLSRPTVLTYLESLRIANNIYLVSPFHGGGKKEITQRPKCYAFDTGFVTYIKGWNEIREEDRGILWEHLVLDLLSAHLPGEQVYYWRDKSNREIDFVLKTNNKSIDIFECKINPDNYSVYPASVFRSYYPSGRNFCISPFIKEKYTVRIKDLKIEFIGTVRDYLSVSQS